MVFYAYITYQPFVISPTHPLKRYVDAKNRQRVFGGLTVKMQADKMTLLRKGAYMGDQIYLIR